MRVCREEEREERARPDCQSNPCRCMSLMREDVSITRLSFDDRGEAQQKLYTPIRWPATFTDHDSARSALQKATLG